MKRYRQLARFQNHRHSPRYNIKLKLFDERKNLSSEYARMMSFGFKLTILGMAQSYFGTNDTSRTMAMLASTAVRHPVLVIQSIGEVMNIANPQLCTRKHEFEIHGAATSKYAFHWIHCHVNRSFIRLQSIYPSTF